MQDFPFTDILDILRNEQDPHKRIHRYQGMLHGSKKKLSRPLYQQPQEVIYSWTSIMKSAVKEDRVGLQFDVQCLIENGFVNHLLIFISHGIAHWFEENYCEIPRDDISVDHFLHDVKIFQEDYEKYPYHASEILYYILRKCDNTTFGAIIERYFSARQNGPKSSNLINDGKHVIMNGVGVFYKQLRYSLVTTRLMIVNSLNIIYERCGMLPKNILFNQKFPLLEALVDFLSISPESVFEDFRVGYGNSQRNIYDLMHLDPLSKNGKDRLFQWTEVVKSKITKTIGEFVYEAKRIGNRRLCLDPKYGFSWSEDSQKKK